MKMKNKKNELHVVMLIKGKEVDKFPAINLTLSSIRRAHPDLDIRLKEGYTMGFKSYEIERLPEDARKEVSKIASRYEGDGSFGERLFINHDVYENTPEARSFLSIDGESGKSPYVFIPSMYRKVFEE